MTSGLFQPALAALPVWALQHLPVIAFLLCFGACVGSFLNVVIYRLPAGMSVITPPSRCPTCGARLKFFRENLPIFGWLMIRGRCRYCGVRVSPQYMLIELLMAGVFIGLYAVLFMASTSGSSWWGQVGGDWWVSNTIFRAWPVFVAFAFMLAALLAMTVIDARTMTIPLEIPLFVTITAFVAYPLQSLLPHRSWSGATWPIPGVDWPWFMTAVGGMAGVVLALILRRANVLHHSFADYHEHVDENEPVGDYPHARREMGVEILFLLPCIIGLVAGHVIGRQLPAAPPPELAQALGGTFLGYLSGGGLVWAIRILGTLGFGREAMGLGDVHLLAAVGAVLGWFDPILIFFIAPFSGILWVVLSMGISTVFKTARRELPYGPHLAVATLLVMLGRPGLIGLLQVIMPGVAFPEAGLVVRADADNLTLPAPRRGTRLAWEQQRGPKPLGILQPPGPGFRPGT